jgi:hypothetical protein
MSYNASLGRYIPDPTGNQPPTSSSPLEAEKPSCALIACLAVVIIIAVGALIACPFAGAALAGLVSSWASANFYTLVGIIFAGGTVAISIPFCCRKLCPQFQPWLIRKFPSLGRSPKFLHHS